MAHNLTTKTIYVSNGVGINTDDVAAVLGSSSHDVATLCKHDAINPWARYKPERIDTPCAVTEEQRKANNYGLAPSQTFNSLSSLLTAVGNGTFKGGWTYNKIRPGIDWSRLTDFDGYNGLAPSPFGNIQAGESVVGTGNEVRIPMTVPILDSTCLNLKDFETYKNYYLGALLYISTSKYRIGTCDTTLEKSPNQWTINLGSVATSDAGTYKAVPFLSSNKIIPGSTTFPANTIIVGTGNLGVTWIIKTSGDLYSAVINWNYPNPSVNQVKMTITLKNKSSSTKAFTNLAIQLSKSNTGQDAITVKTLENVTLEAGKEKIWEVTASVNVSGIASSNYTFARLSYYGSTDQTWWPFSSEMLPPSENIS